MPVPKRYFHLSQDINGDPEMWSFTSEFGDRSLRTWVQVLVYLDKSGNEWGVVRDSCADGPPVGGECFAADSLDDSQRLAASS